MKRAGVKKQETMTPVCQFIWRHWFEHLPAEMTKKGRRNSRCFFIRQRTNLPKLHEALDEGWEKKKIIISTIAIHELKVDC